jgi:hypothetical protein
MSLSTILKKAIVKIPLLLVLAIQFLCITTCDSDQPDLEDPGQMMSFWLNVRMDNDAASMYRPVRMFIMDDGTPATEKIGQCSGPVGSGVDNKFKITLPQTYKGNELKFSIELEVKDSGFDNIPAFTDKINRLRSYSGDTLTLPPNIFDFLNDYPIVLGLLKSRYYSGTITIPTVPGNEIEKNVQGESVIIGYSPGSIQLDDLKTQIPPLYLLKVDMDPSVINYGFILSAVIATNAVPGAKFTDVVGISAPELDWALIILPGTLSPGDNVKLWYLFTAPEGGHACPCGTGCDIETCVQIDTGFTIIPFQCFYSAFSNSIFVSSNGPPSRDGVPLPAVLGTEIKPLPKVETSDFDIDFSLFPSPIPIPPGTTCGSNP